MMASRKFVNRIDELNELNRLYANEEFKLVIVTGRRRIGKTRLVREFLKDKKSISVQFEKRVWKYNLAKFNRSLAEFFKIPVPNFETFYDAFEFLVSQNPGRIVVFLDEFSYLLRYSDVEAEFQTIVDEILQESEIMLILSASSVGLLKRSFFEYSAPLYGRSDATLNLMPLKFTHIFEWFNKISPEDAVKLYSVTSGVPKYLESFEGKDIESEIVSNFFKPTSFLFREAKELLEEEFKEPETYYTILEAVASGKTRMSEIAAHAYMEPNNAAKYLRILEDVGILKREFSVFGRKSKGIYRFRDLYFAFWFRFVAKHFEDIESGFYDAAVYEFSREFDSYLGYAFEDIVKDLLIEMSRSGRIPFRFTEIGKWWKRGEEIDIVALNEVEKKALLVEVKWREMDRRDAKRILGRLERKSEMLRLDGWEIDYRIVCKKCEEKNSQILDLRDLVITS
ncbi:ATP-binding protein [Geoglobus ahangari]